MGQTDHPSHNSWTEGSSTLSHVHMLLKLGELKSCKMGSAKISCSLWKEGGEFISDT